MSTRHRAGRWWVIAFCACLAGCGGGVGRFEFEKTGIDVGAVPKVGGEFSIDFRNRGDGVLRIESVSTSCSCSLGKATESVAPGASGSVTLQLKYAAPGRGSARVMVRSSDPDGPHFVNVTWFGIHEPRLAPSELLVGGVSPGETVSRRIQVMYAGGDSNAATTLLSTSSNLPGGRITLRKDDLYAKMHSSISTNQVAVAGEMTLDLEFRAPDSPGRHTYNCEIRVAQVGKEYQLKLPVAVVVEGAVSAIPGRLALLVQPGDALSRARGSVSVMVRSGRPKVVSCPDFLTARLLPTEGSARLFRLEVQGAPRTATLPQKGVVWLGVDGSSEKAQVDVSIDAAPGS